MSVDVMTESPTLVVRGRDLSNAASHHLLSKEGSAAGLAAAMLVDVKRIKAGLDARVQADIVAISPDGRFRLVEVKRIPKDGRFAWISHFGKNKDHKAA